MAVGKIGKSVRNQAEKLLKTGSRFDRFDQIRERHFWSTWRVTADANGYVASGERAFFQTAEGGTGQGFARELTVVETNWKGNNRVPDNQNLEVKEIGISIGSAETSTTPFTQATFSTTLSAFLNNMVLAVKYLTNTVPLGLGMDFAQASGVTVGNYAPRAGAAADFVSPTRTFQTNGFPAPALRRRFRIPILLGHGETFSFSMIFPRTFLVVPGLIGPLATVAAFDVRFDFYATESFVEKS